jgi:hypothetical protein
VIAAAQRFAPGAGLVVAVHVDRVVVVEHERVGGKGRAAVGEGQVLEGHGRAPVERLRQDADGPAREGGVEVAPL